MCNNKVFEDKNGNKEECWLGFVNCKFWYPYIFGVKNGVRVKSKIAIYFSLIWMALCIPMYVIYILFVSAKKAAKLLEPCEECMKCCAELG